MSQSRLLTNIILYCRYNAQKLFYFNNYFSLGKGRNIWDTFSHIPGKVRYDDNGDMACDSYHKYMDDVKLLKDLKVGILNHSSNKGQFRLGLKPGCIQEVAPSSSCS